MARQMRHGRSEEAKELRDWCLAVLNFMNRLEPSSPFFLQAIQAIDRVFAKGDLAGLRAAAKDLRQWSKEFPTDQRTRLDELLVSRFGFGLQQEAAKDGRVLQRVLKNGVIRTEEEFRVLSNRADEIHADEARSPEMRRITRLLAAFQRPIVED